jgi:hypothetical protein
MQINTQQSTALNNTAFAVSTSNEDHSHNINVVMRPKQKGANDAKTNAKPLSTGVKKMVNQANVLVQQFGRLKVDVLDRSDRALWNYLQAVNEYKVSIENHPDKQAIKTALLTDIHLRDGVPMSSASSLEAVVARYIFGDQSRQTRNNYTVVMEKAAALNIASDKFADFLAEHGGVSKVVEHVFDDEANTVEIAKQIGDANKANQATRTGLVQRYFSAAAHNVESELSFAGDVINWVQPKPAKKGKVSEKADPKHEEGQFVFFVTVQDPNTGKYRVVQGNIFDKAYEQKLLGEIATRMATTTSELKQAVQSLEQAIGFEDLNEEGTPIED